MSLENIVSNLQCDGTGIRGSIEREEIHSSPTRGFDTRLVRREESVDL